MACNGLCTIKWDPKKIVSGESPNLVCVVLNRRINIPPQTVKRIWQNASLRCTVDGGTNRWRDFLLTHFKENSMKPPDLITGDFDSISEESINYFKGTRRVHTPDQNETDFTKAIRECKSLTDEKQINNFIVFHDNCGRFDHIMANINTLFKVQCPCLNVFLLSGNSLTWLLSPGRHTIQIPSDLVENSRWCALMPIGGPAIGITTKGLKWNLENSSMRFGEMVSTSNTYANEFVEIECRDSLVWSMGLFRFEDD